MARLVHISDRHAESLAIAARFLRPRRRAAVRYHRHGGAWYAIVSGWVGLSPRVVGDMLSFTLAGYSTSDIRRLGCVPQEPTVEIGPRESFFQRVWRLEHFPSTLCRTNQTALSRMNRRPVLDMPNLVFCWSISPARWPGRVYVIPVRRWPCGSWAVPEFFWQRACWPSWRPCFSVYALWFFYCQWKNRSAGAVWPPPPHERLPAWAESECLC